MRALLLLVPALLMAQTPATKDAPKAAPKAAASTTTMTEDQKTIYALGLNIAQSLKQFDLSPAELELVKRGLTDGSAGGKPVVELTVYGPKIQGLVQARSAAAAAKEKANAGAFLAKAAAEPGAVKTASGLIYTVERAGTGASPKATDTVKAHYRGTLTNGTEFDSSYKREPLVIPLNQVIKCWTEGIGKMKVGGKSKLVCPSDIAYGDTGHPPTIPGGSTLIFEVELLEIVPAGGK